MGWVQFMAVVAVSFAAGLLVGWAIYHRPPTVNVRGQERDVREFDRPSRRFWDWVEERMRQGEGQ